MMRTTRGIAFRVIVVAVVVGTFFVDCHNTSAEDVSSLGRSIPAPYRSPFCVATAVDGQTAYVTDRSGGSLVILDTTQGTTLNEIALCGHPQGLSP